MPFDRKTAGDARMSQQAENHDHRIYNMGHFDSTNGDYKPPTRTFGIPYDEAAANLKANADRLPGVTVASFAEFQEKFGPRVPLNVSPRQPPSRRERLADRVRAFANWIDR